MFDKSVDHLSITSHFEVKIAIYAFDMIYLNDASLLKKSFRDRRYVQVFQNPTVISD